MLKIDIHTHILAENLNTIINQFSDPRYLRIKSNNSNSAVLFKDNKKFRTVNCNCWDHHLRIRDCNKTDVDIQVLSTLPALFSYWAKDTECLLLSEFLNNHIHSVINEYPQDFIGLGTIPMQNTDLAIKEMDRCINNLNFPGIQIGSNVNQKNLSNKEFHPIFEHAEKINCSILTQVKIGFKAGTRPSLIVSCRWMFEPSAAHTHACTPNASRSSKQNVPSFFLARHRRARFGPIAGVTESPYLRRIAINQVGL